MKKVPEILQMEAVECGAASLSMILSYYGLKLPLEEVREECGVTRDGSKASRILGAARKYGLEAKGYKTDIKQLNNSTFPAIIFWNFNHYVVLTKFTKNKFYINDPASGRKVVDYEEFDGSFTGIILEFKLTDKFQKEDNKESNFNRLRKRIKGNLGSLWFTILCGLLLVFPGLLIPVFSKVFIDNILISGYAWIKPLMLTMSIVIIVMGILTWMQQTILNKLELKIAMTTSSKFFNHIFRLPVNFFFQRQSGEINKRIQLNDKLAKLLTGDLAKNILNLISIVFYALVMFSYDITLTIIGIFFVLLNFILLKVVSEKRVLLTQKINQTRGKLFSSAMVGLLMMETIKSTGGEDGFFSKWSGYQSKLINNEQRIGFTDRLLSSAPTFLNQTNNVILLVLGGLLVIKGEITIGLLIAFQALMSSFSSPVNELVGMGGKLQEAVSDMTVLDDALKNGIDDRFKISAGRESKTSIDGHVELKNITFGYDKYAPPLIEDFSINIPPGKRVALVGGSGSGKSTIAKLIMGLYPTWKGEVLFDGHIRTYHSPETMRNCVCMVDQQIFLFAGTISENITMWDSTIEESKIVKSGKDACIHQVISDRKDAYNSRLTEGGSNFSGGQQQRIEIARALVNDPSVLVMDEATSALDPNTEKQIDTNIRKRGCTSIIIAHRLSTIRDCDEIIVMEKGKVVQRGSHEEMVDKKDSPYYNLVKNT